MDAAGFAKTGQQCSGKIKKLRFDYRKIKDCRGKTGRGRKEWKFFEAMDAVLGHKPATCPPVVIESGSSSLSCDLEPTVSSPTTMSSSSTVSTNIDNNDYVVEEDDSVVGSEIARSSSHERDELSSSRSETPVYIEEVTPSQKGSRKRKRISDKFDRVEGLMEKMIKIQEDSEKSSREVELKIFEMEERRQKESQDFQMRLLSLLQTPKIQPQVSNIHGTSNMQAQDLSCDMYSNYNLYSNPLQNDDI